MTASVHDVELQIEYRSPAVIAANPRNARKHPDAQVAEIARSMKRFGFVDPVLVDEHDVIIAGHGRLLAAQQIGLVSVPTITLQGFTETEKAVLALADNAIPFNAEWDVDVLRDEIIALRTGGEDIEGLGFSKKDLDHLFADDKPIEVREVPTSEVQDRFWIAIRGPLKDQAAALRALDVAMKPFPEVEVELGTIAIE